MGTPLPYGSRHVGNPVFRRVLRLERFRRPVRTVHTLDKDVSLLGAFRGSKELILLLTRRGFQLAFPRVVYFTSRYWDSSNPAFAMSVSPCIILLANQLCLNVLYQHAMVTLQFPVTLSWLDLWVSCSFPQGSVYPIMTRRDTAHSLIHHHVMGDAVLLVKQ